MFNVELSEQELIFRVDYKNRDRAKKLGAWWDPQRKVWYRDLEKLCAGRTWEKLRHDLMSAGFDLLPETEQALENYYGVINERAIEIERTKVDFDAPQPDGIMMNLRPYQRAGVKFLENLKAGILGDDCGLGKTCQAIGWARHKSPCLVIVPAVAKWSWIREIKKCRPDDSIILIDRGKKKKFYGNGSGTWVVINFDILGRWLSSLSEMKFQSVIVDEAHMIKSRTAQRSVHCKVLGAGISSRLCVTATPVMNRPMELFAILEMIGVLQGKDLYWWKNRYCLTEGGKVVGVKNLGELQGRIRNFFIRRLKCDVERDLPPKIYKDTVVRLSNRKEYEQCEADVIRWILEHEGEEKATMAMRAEALVRLTKLQTLASIGKLWAVDALLNELREDEKKAVIFSNRNESIETLYNKYRNESVIVKGDVTGEDREKAIRRFQEDPNVRWFFGGIKACGMNITLTASENVIFLDYPWTPAAKIQAEDRCHRIGTVKAVIVHHLMGEASIDTYMMDIIAEKAAMITQLVDGMATVTEDYQGEHQRRMAAANEQMKADEAGGREIWVDVMQKMRAKHRGDHAETMGASCGIVGAVDSSPLSS